MVQMGTVIFAATTFAYYINLPLFQPIFHAIWLFFVLRLLEVKKTGGATSEVFCVAGKAHDACVRGSDTNEDVPEEEDDDVITERDNVRLLQAGSHSEQVQQI